jgi:branched-chain amino acid transport system ATP-binding protein
VSAGRGWRARGVLMKEILKTVSLSKYFGKLKAVSEVSFEVREGEIFGIAGPNGAGKSTLFNAISGIPYHANSGKIFFKGREIQRTPPHVICHSGIARTFQKETVFETLSVMENMFVASAFSKYYADCSEKERHEKGLEILDFIGLGNCRHREAVHLSLLEKKLLMLATALVTQPKLLLLDEPASGLTPEETRQLDSLLHKLNEKGITIILIEHVLHLLLRVSERVMILNEGKKLAEGTPDEVVKDEMVIKAYLGGKGACV